MPNVPIADPGDPAVPFFANPLKMAWNVWRQCGTRALVGFARLGGRDGKRVRVAERLCEGRACGGEGQGGQG